MYIRSKQLGAFDFDATTPHVSTSFLEFRAQGGKRAALRTLVYGAAAALGGTRPYRVTEWGRIRRLVFVCKGNICRSPFAEAVAKKRGLDAASIGVGADPGVAAAPQAIEAAASFGVNLSDHRATNAVGFPLRSDDLVVGFEPFHVVEMIAINQASKRPAESQFTLLGIWFRPPNLYIHDPYGTDPKYFHACFGRIDRAVELLSHRIGRSLIDDRE